MRHVPTSPLVSTCRILKVNDSVPSLSSRNISILLVTDPETCLRDALHHVFLLFRTWEPKNSTSGSDPRQDASGKLEVALLLLFVLFMLDLT